MNATPAPLSPRQRSEFTAWFRLLETPGMGRTNARRLLAACGSPEAVLETAPDTLRRIVPATLVDALGQLPPSFEARLAAALDWLEGGPGRCTLTLGDPAYPPALLATADPPLLLYAQGQLGWLQLPALAIVGSRHASAQGLDNARGFARELATQGWVVVSGLALGIDAAAHEGALQAAGGASIAVVGTGLDSVYPAAHRSLAQRLAAQGLLLSEYAPGTPAVAGNFPQRNRIIAGLAQGTLVVEAALRSGSLLTARMAVEAGREVFAVPGSIHAPHSKGCHQLIKQGAKLVESGSDITEELRAPMQQPLLADAAGASAGTGPAEAADEPGAHSPLLAALGHDPVTLDALVGRTGWDAATLNVKLLELELAGEVARLPGGLFQRRVGV